MTFQQIVSTTMIGADPELFLFNKSGKAISSLGKIGGTKDCPMPVLQEHGKGYAIQEDNVTIEYNIPATASPKAFAQSNTLINNYINNIVNELGLVTKAIPSQVFEEDELQHPMAFVFGCDPDFNAWELSMNRPPRSEDKPFLRSAGGHIHVSTPDDTDNRVKVTICRLMDYMLGVPLNALDPANERAALYGKPGAMRFKDYGLEYRVPSNGWTALSEVIQADIARVAKWCAASVITDDRVLTKLETNQETVEKYFTAKKVSRLQASMLDMIGAGNFTHLLAQRGLVV